MSSTTKAAPRLPHTFGEGSAFIREDFPWSPIFDMHCRTVDKGLLMNVVGATDTSDTEAK